ncbi:MAG: two-component regulator propeller domain-containing protein [Bacteroidota bacterium]
MLNKVINVLLILLIASHIEAQNYSFINYSVEKGLAQSQATDIVQDDNGYLWISTLGGLSHFDGLTFENFSRESGLLDNYVNTLFHHNNTVYVGCKGGISIVKEKEINSFAFPEKYKEAKVMAIGVSEKDVYVGTDIAGLWHFKDGIFTFIESLPFDKVRSLTVIDNFILIGSNEGLFRYFFETNEWDIPFPSLSEKRVQDIMIDQNNILWIGTYEGLYVHETSLEHYSTEDGLISNRIKKIHQDNKGNIWVSTKYGVSKIGGKNILNFDESNGLSNHDIKSVFCDLEGNIWMASNGSGIFKFSGEHIYTYTKDEQKYSRQALCIIEDGNEDLWLGSFNEGLYAEKQKGFDLFNTENGFPDNTIWSGIEDQNGVLWFGTSNGLARIEDKEVSISQLGKSAGTDRITALFEDSQGKIWIGHKFGVRIMEPGKVTEFSEEQGFSGKRIRSIKEDSSGTVWLGADNGLYKYAENSFSKVSQKKIFDDNTVLNIAFDSRSNIWLGTKDGLFIYDGSVFHRVYIGEQFASNYINFSWMQKDHIILGSNNGLYVINIEKYLDGQANYARHFGLEQGLPNLECNLNAVCLNSKNQLIFGTGNGLAIAELNYLISDEHIQAPLVHINNVRVFMEDKIKRGEKELNAFGTHSFLANENHISFDIAGLCLSKPQSVQFEYRLKGMQEQFLPLKNSSFVSFPFLPHGNYEFEVFAIAENGTRSDQAASYAFEIIAPFHKTGAFNMLLALFVIGLIALIYLWRRRVQKRNIEQQRLVYRSRILSLEQQSLNSSMNRHFIFNALNSIQYYINRQDKLAANKYLSNFAKLIRKNLDSSQENLTLLANELERIDLYLSLEHMRFQDKFDYDIEIDPKIDPSTIKIPSMLLQPFLENSIWHGILPKEEKGKIKLNIKRSLSGSIKIIIDDDGIGVRRSIAQKNGKDHIHESKGVSLTNDRISLYQKLTHENFKIKGPYELKDTNDEVMGTRVEIFLPESQTFEEIISETNKLGKLALNT